MAAEYKDYYKILGVAKDADEKTIKSAYRKLARQHHPDVNAGDKKSEDKFKEIGEAYEVLSDPEKRGKYDQFGDQWKAYSQGGGGSPGGQGGPFGGGFSSVQFGGNAGGVGGLDDLFSSLFGGETGARGFGGFQSSARKPAPRQGNVEMPIEITLEEAYRGTTRSFQITLPTTCGRCHGQGAVSSGKPCPTCDGSGKVRGGGRNFFGGECPQCGGSGQAMQACAECHGSGQTEIKKRVQDVRIPAGVKPDQRIRLAGQGADGGDIYLKVHIKPDPRFERKNDDLYTDFPVPYTVAALGGEAGVDTLDGRKVLRVPAGTQSGSSFRLTGIGMPTLKGTKGNLYARAKLTVPKDLSPRERELLYEIAKLRKDEVNYGA